MADPVRILLVEDNAVFREALELLLGMQTDVAVVESVEDGETALERVPDLDVDVILLDYRLPGIDGVEATRALRELRPDVPVVCLTASANPREREAMLAAGAEACLTKDEELDAIVAAVRAAAHVG